MPTTAAHALLLRLQAGLPVVLDGDLFTSLERRGWSGPAPLFAAAAVREAPDVLAQIHARFVQSGAQLLRANTGRTTPRVLRQVGYEYRAAAVTSRAIDLALAAAQEGSASVAVAGVIEPLEGRLHPELTPSAHDLDVEHGQHVERLAAMGCDSIYVEGVPTLRELLAVLGHAVPTGLPVMVHAVIGPDGKLGGGEDAGFALRAAHEAGAMLVIAGSATPGECERSIGTLRQAGTAFGIVPDLPPRASVDRLIAAMRVALSQGACLVGGAHGVGPEELEKCVLALGLAAGG